MKKSTCLIAYTLLMLAVDTSASPAEATRIIQAWDIAVEKWSLEMRTATTPQAHEAALARQPNRLTEARRMWDQIGGSLDHEWTLEPAAWFLRSANGLLENDSGGSKSPAFGKETQEVFQAVEVHHLKSPKLVPMCMALAATGSPRALAILERIQAVNPDKRIRGVAAMATAIVLKSLGEDPELMRKRLLCITQAIKDSHDVDLGRGVTVTKLAEEELYIIRHLNKGRVAPDLAGTDSGNRPLKLSGESGRIVMLLFWSSTMNEADRVIEMTHTVRQRFEGRPVTVLGVSLDPVEKLRALEADGTVSWRNFSDPDGKLTASYRVDSVPFVYVLDGSRRVHFSGTPGSFAELTVEALLSELKPTDAE